MNGVFYCRLHEHEHLRVTAQAHTINLARLGLGISPTADGCWLRAGATNDDGYGTFVPEGANIAKLYTHRVAWDLLIGGHKPGLELDHRTCKRRHCVNQLHLEPVTSTMNQQRKRNGPEWGWTNPTASNRQMIYEFAANHGLPVPDQAAHPSPERPHAPHTRNPEPSP